MQLYIRTSITNRHTYSIKKQLNFRFVWIAGMAALLVLVISTVLWEMQLVHVLYISMHLTMLVSRGEWHGLATTVNSTRESIHALCCDFFCAFKIHWASGLARGKPILMKINRGEALKKLLARKKTPDILRICACPGKTLTKTCARQRSQPAGARTLVFSFTPYLWNTVESPSALVCACFNFHTISL